MSISFIVTLYYPVGLHALRLCCLAVLSVTFITAYFPWCYNPNLACVATLLRLLDRTQLDIHPVGPFSTTDHHYCVHATVLAQSTALLIKAKVKSTPVQAWTGPHGCRRIRSQISRQTAHEGGKVVNPKNRPPLTSSNYSWYSFLVEFESNLELLWGRKESGIEPATFWNVEQCLSTNCTTACPRTPNDITK